MRRVGNATLTRIVNSLFGTRYTDLCYGYNAFWRRHVPILDVDCDGFEVETLLHLRAVKAGLRVVEVPSYEHSRIHGASNLRIVRDGAHVLGTILRERFRRPAGRSGRGQEALKRAPAIESVAEAPDRPGREPTPSPDGEEAAR
jgi:hypothetical protein